MFPVFLVKCYKRQAQRLTLHQLLCCLLACWAGLEQ